MSVVEKAAKRLEELRGSDLTVGRPVADGGLSSEERSKASIRSVEPSPDFVGAPNKAQRNESNRVSISVDRLTAQGLVSPAEPKSEASEEFRVIKRPLIRNASGKGAAIIENGNLIMITSALPGEGKTSSAISLAMSIAMELDKTALLVDADVAKPSVLQKLGLNEHRGLLDVLLDRSIDLSSVILRTNVEKLAILPSGSPHPQATELLASNAMAELLKEMSNRYSDRIIIFDSPPLLLTNEAPTLAAHMGQIVIVVEAEQTSHAALQQALGLIETCPVKLLLLNKTKHDGKSSYYGSYGESGYGQSDDGA